MKSHTSKRLACIALFTASLALSAVAADVISLNSEQWTAAPEAKLSTANNQLRVKSLASSLWLVPSKRLSYEEGDVLELRYDLRGGNIIVQANWFGQSGQFLETTTLGKATSADDKALFRVTCSPESARLNPNYELKIWVEADMPSLTLQSIQVRQDVKRLPILSGKDFEASELIAVEELDRGALRLTLADSQESGSVLTQKRFKLNEAGKVELEVDSVSISSAFSVQAIFWSDAGTYLGHADLLKDATHETKERIDFRRVDLPEGATQYSFKFWLSGTGASADVSLSLGR